MSSSVPMALDYAYGLCNGLKNTIRRKHNLGTFALFLRPDDYSDVASGWAGWALTLLQPRGQILTTTLLLPHPDLKT